MLFEGPPPCPVETPKTIENESVSKRHELFLEKHDLGRLLKRISSASILAVTVLSLGSPSEASENSNSSHQIIEQADQPLPSFPDLALAEPMHIEPKAVMADQSLQKMVFSSPREARLHEDRAHYNERLAEDQEYMQRLQLMFKELGIESALHKTDAEFIKVNNSIRKHQRRKKKVEERINELMDRQVRLQSGGNYG